MADRIATTVWDVSNALVVALDERLGPPVDCYVNGSQTWLTDDGPNGITVEWRLHPVAAYAPPSGISHYDLFETVVATIAAHPDAVEFELGDEMRTLSSLWEGLECFAAYDDDPEPPALVAAVTEKLGIVPGASGLVDHEAVAVEWERAGRAVSILAALRAQLHTP
jgi:hypothetical protein